MRFAELRQHPEWPDLLHWLATEVDNARTRVLTESIRGDIESVRYASGQYETLRDVHKVLSEGR